MNRFFLFLSMILVLSANVYGQRTVAITIDDVPNTTLYQRDGYRPILLERIDSLGIPASIFINEKLVWATDSSGWNLGVLEQWIMNRNITPGTHTFSHPHYSETMPGLFRDDLVRGTAMTSALASKHGRESVYFRLPYNDLGVDSLQHARLNDLLEELGLKMAPFTVESADYAFSPVYVHYLEKGDTAGAEEVRERYLSTTIRYFRYFDSLSVSIYGRHISQIYLCHDNALNAACLPQLVSRMKDEGYRIVSLDEAMSDPVYSQPDLYNEKWGVSWFYRWIGDRKERIRLMRAEPGTGSIEDEAEKILNDRK